jgi:L-amino acid N-acyltransferase YncA
MRPVRAAIERHVKDSDAITEIYNRAYEALMISMDVKDAELAAERSARLDAEARLRQGRG